VLHFPPSVALQQPDISFASPISLFNTPTGRATGAGRLMKVIMGLWRPPYLYSGHRPRRHALPPSPRRFDPFGIPSRHTFPQVGLERFNRSSRAKFSFCGHARIHFFPPLYAAEASRRGHPAHATRPFWPMTLDTGAAPICSSIPPPERTPSGPRGMAGYFLLSLQQSFRFALRGPPVSFCLFLFYRFSSNLFSLLLRSSDPPFPGSAPSFTLRRGFPPRCCFRSCDGPSDCSPVLYQICPSRLGLPA